MQCFSCKKEIVLGGNRIGRRDDCPHCGRDLHCCFNCTFYDPKVYNECRELQADRVLEKEKSNFCDYFSPTEKSAGAKTAVDEAKKKLEELFKKK